MNRYELLRYEAGLTRAAAAAQSGIPLRTLRNIERGVTSRPSAPHAKALAELYDISVAELLGVETPEAA